MVLPLAAAVVILTAPTVWLVVPKSTVPPPKVNAAVPLPKVPDPLMASVPAFTVVPPE